MTGTKQDPPLRVLVVEDEPKLALLVQRALVEHGHVADIAYRGDHALRAAEETAYDAIVLDVMLPGLNGLEVCRRLRERGDDACIIMLTARNGVDERIAGLDAGADDYLAKPFALRELYARLRAVRRRTAGTAGAGRGADAHGIEELLVVGDLELLRGEHACRVGDTVVQLRRKEFAILELLMRRAGMVVSRVELLDAAWDEDLDHRSNVIEAQIKRLRDRIDRPFGRDSIETLRGVGYRLRRESPAQ